MRKYMTTIPILLLFMTGCDAMTFPPIECVPTSSETFTSIVSDPQLDMLTRTSLERFPKDIFFGDPFFLVFYDENLSDETVTHSTTRPFYSEASITSPLISKTYSWVTEYSGNVYDEIILPEKKLFPGEKYRSSVHYFECPPLEDWNDPFWKEMRETMPPEGVVCQFRLSYWHDPKNNSSQRYKKSVVQEILIKSRPKSEMALLEQWYNDTPKMLFPKVDGDRKVPYDIDLKSSGKSDIIINGNKYDPWLFIRLGNRKPSDPNNPTTLDGWRELEASLIPSTMRDEVRLTRLQLEYYSAKKGEASDNAKRELVEWLKSLPEVQRTIMFTSLVGKSYYFAHSREDYTKPTPLSEKNRELMESFSVFAKQSDNQSERVEVSRSMNEILEPTKEDLALNSKELPDGFRIWDAVGDVGPVRMVAQFVELKEDDDTIIVKHREGWNINWIFSKLTEEDKQFAREQGEKNSQTNNVSE